MWSSSASPDDETFAARPTRPVERRIEVAVLSHRGAVRSRNEDAAGFAGWAALDGVVAQRDLRVRGDLSICCAVADGVGGHPAGARASAAALSSVMAAEQIADGACTVKAIEHAHARLHDEMDADPRCRGMATTLALLVVSGADVLVANVGDTRIYELAGGDLLTLSIDDRPHRPEWIGDGAQTSLLTQVLGGYERAAVPRPHIDRCPFEDGLRFLLCSDGLGACLTEEEVVNVLVAADDAQAVRALVDRCLRVGAPDNVTAMLVRLHERRRYG